MTIASLIADPAADVAAIARHLDALAPDARAAEVLALSRAAQRTLYEKAAAAAPLDLAHLVGTAAPGVEVIHDGRNTLPVPTPLRRFQKRFARASADGPRLFGYNEGPTRRVIGPGYFVAYPTAGRPAWQARGAIVVDYFEVPDGPVPAGWPPIVDNAWRLQRLVYHHTRDFLRRVSTHVAIGAAYKDERPLDHYFVLCRRP